jgi:hypothetical protein
MPHDAPSADDPLRFWDAQASAEQLQRHLRRLRDTKGPLVLHHTVDDAVRRYVALEAVRQTPGSTWLPHLCRALPEGSADPPRLDDPTPEASLCETLLLAAAACKEPLDEHLDGIAAGTRAIHGGALWRLGHVVLRASPDKAEAQILPILAVLLLADRRDEVRRRASDLGWDRLLQQAAEGPATSAELARIALDSPARRLARSPEAVHERHLGLPIDHDAQRLLDAVGDLTTTAFAAAVPGHLADRKRSEIAVELLLEELKAAPTAWRRSDALVRLLQHAPTSTVAGVELDLRREAAANIAAALSSEGPPQRSTLEQGFRRADWLRLEVAALHHGAVLAARVAPDNIGQRVRAAWRIGDWIGRVVRESPFFGADPELLAARLEAVLPAKLPEADEALWPASVGTDATSLRLDDLWLLHALLVARARWQPPGPVLDGLRRLAGRIVNDVERRAEAHLEQERDVLGWPGPHLAPPLAARWLLHAHQAQWLGSLPVEVQAETLGFLKGWLDRGRAPRGGWIMLALYREAPHLGGLEGRSISLWTAVADRAEDLPTVLGEALAPFCLWGSTLFPRLEPRYAEILTKLSMRTPPRWRVGVLMTLAVAVRSQEASRTAREALLELIGTKEEPALRLPAAIATIQVAQKLPADEREDLLNRAVARLGGDLRAHPALRVELKRAGRTF